METVNDLLVERLREENEELRIALETEWDLAHSARCCFIRTGLICPEADCQWPRPEILEEE